MRAVEVPTVEEVTTWLSVPDVESGEVPVGVDVGSRDRVRAAHRRRVSHRALGRGRGGRRRGEGHGGATDRGPVVLEGDRPVGLEGTGSWLEVAEAVTVAVYLTL